MLKIRIRSVLTVRVCYVLNYLSIKLFNSMQFFIYLYLHNENNIIKTWWKLY